ncbi:sigma 54-interacting transcriptional regulator [Pendulispora rubella]|uniref:sigma 54-interacting transcriptional regulator n=1 Tax=Pendulispora rubella TaxID=2741070 RepID=UPI0030E5024F
MSTLAHRKIRCTVVAQFPLALRRRMQPTTLATMRAIPSTRKQAQSKEVILGVAVRQDGTRFPIDTTPLVVGRHERTNIVLKDPEASASHVQLTATALGIEIEDMDSANGTLLTTDMLGERIDWTKAQRVERIWVKHPVRLRCGNSELKIFPEADFTNRDSDPEPSGEEDFPLLTGKSPPMRALFRNLRSFAPTELSILITGPTGVGKERVARAIHALSARRRGPFVTVDCGALPATLADSELFGHVRGGFTGATEDRASPFELAKGGTIFLDEIGELPLDLQPKLLRAIETREIKRVGSNQYIKIDVRIVAATHRDLIREINDEASFRSDLYYRTAEFTVHVPSLRDRIEDLPLLLSSLAEEEKARIAGGPTKEAEDVAENIVKRISPESMDRLMRHDWQGNIRELRSVVLTGLVLWPRGPLPLEQRLSDPLGKMASSNPPPEPLKDVEKNYWRRMAIYYNGKVSHIAAQAGVDRRTAKKKLIEFGAFDWSDLLDED